MPRAAIITITSSWREYFANPDEGLGSTYERFILHRYFARLKERYAVHSVLEAPSFGMTGVSGINSLWWASQGVNVTIVDDNSDRLQSIQQVWRDTGLPAEFVYQSPTSAALPFPDSFFDLAWNFAALWHVREGERYLSELARVASRALFLCVPNNLNICWMLRPHNGAEYELNHIRTDWITSCLASCGWQKVETGFFDVPPWPDIAMKKEAVLQRIGLGQLAKSLAARKVGARMCILDYFNGRAPAIEGEVMRYSFLEQSPVWLKKFWAHHRFLLFEKVKL